MGIGDDAGPDRGGDPEPEVVFYRKERCSLCDEAREVLEAVRRLRPVRVVTVDIMEDEVAFERYAELIPVVKIGEAEFHHRVTEEELWRALDA